VRRSRWLALALIAPALAACGGDDEGSTSTELKAPPMTVPQESTESTDTTTDTESTETAPDNRGVGTHPTETAPADEPNPGNGGVPAPDHDQPPADQGEDSPSNDTPPEPGSPQERFEQFCAQNPGAC
jgi:hypothetical protein